MQPPAPGPLKKLLVFTDTDPSQINGVQLSLDQLRENLDPSVELRIVSPEDFWNFPLPSYNEIHVSLAFPSRIKKILREERPDCVHIATEGPIGFVAAKACKDLGLPYTSAFHTKFPEYVQLRNRYIPSSYVHTFLRYIHDGSDRILISNDSMRSYMEENGYRHARVVPFGIDHEIFRPGKKNCFAGLPRPILLYVGRVAIEKNLEDFLDIPTRGTKVVVGDGPLREKLERRYSDALFLGYKTRVELADVYRSADLFVLPSKTDTLGLVTLEAMACGLPVLAYDVDGPRGIVRSGLNGILVKEGGDLASGVEAALALDPADCIRSVADYTWGAYARQFMDHQSPISENQWT